MTAAAASRRELLGFASAGAALISGMPGAPPLDAGLQHGNAAHSDAAMFQACAAFERADLAYCEADALADPCVPNTPSYAAAAAIAQAAYRRRAPFLAALCALRPATTQGHAARAQQVLRVAARFWGPDIEPLHYVDHELLHAAMRDLAALGCGS